MSNNDKQKCALELHNDRDMCQALHEAWAVTTKPNAPPSHIMAFKVLLAMMQHHTVAENKDDATLELMWLGQVMDIRMELSESTTITPARDFETDNIVDFMPHLDANNKTVH